MINKIDHIGIAVSNLEESMKIYTDWLGLKVSEIETLNERKIRLAMIPVGETKVELLEGTGPDSTITKFIAQRGEGIHHIGFGVKNIKEMLKDLKNKGVPLIDQEPRKGSGGASVAFLHPSGAKILIELVEH